MDIEEEFINDFDYWWEGAESYVELSAAEIKKLREVFSEVLSKMPESDRKKFFEEDPKIICNGNLGVVIRYVVPVPFIPIDRQLHISIIFLRHDVIKRKHLQDTVAHEVAHIVRGDHNSGGAPSGSGYKIEKAADDLSHSWGFKRRYSKAMLDKIKR